MYTDKCELPHHGCSAPVALSSWSTSQTTGEYTTWRTFAHEVGHTFGASHTFGLGGLME